MSWKGAIRDWLDAPARRANSAKLSGLLRSGSAGPVVSFGRVLEDRTLIHGGAVKLLHLRKAFPASESAFNILYLVSSAQPRFALDLVRACKERGIAFVWNQNGVGYPGWAGRDTERHNGPMRQLRELADFVVYQSGFCRTSADKFLGSRTGPTATLLNPVDLAAFCPASAPPLVKPLRLLAMGTQNYAARVLSTVDCLSILRKQGVKSVLTIAGNLQWAGADGELTGYAEKLGVRDAVTLRPAFSQEEAVRLYQSHHIVLHPKYLDPCPTVVAEALSCGLPVVASRSGGIPEMTNDDCAELIDVPIVWDRLITPDGPQMADAVERILARYATATRAARSCAEILFDSTRWVEKHREIFSTVLH